MTLVKVLLNWPLFRLRLLQQQVQTSEILFICYVILSCIYPERAFAFPIYILTSIVNKNTQNLSKEWNRYGIKRCHWNKNLILLWSTYVQLQDWVKHSVIAFIIYYPGRRGILAINL